MIELLFWWFVGNISVALIKKCKRTGTEDGRSRHRYLVCMTYRLWYNATAGMCIRPDQVPSISKSFYALRFHKLFHFSSEQPVAVTNVNITSLLWNTSDDSIIKLLPYQQPWKEISLKFFGCFRTFTVSCVFARTLTLGKRNKAKQVLNLTVCKLKTSHNFSSRHESVYELMSCAALGTKCTCELSSKDSCKISLKDSSVQT
jgi:hypothetical protein